MKSYNAGLDVLGAGIGDFVPWLGIVGQLAGGLGGGGSGGGAAPAAGVPAATAVSQKAAIEEALAKERERQRVEAAAKKAKTSNTILYVTLGVVGLSGLGLATYLLTRRK